LLLLLPSTTLMFGMLIMHCFICGPSHPNTAANYNVHHEQTTLGIPKPKLGAQYLRTQLARVLKSGQRMWFNSGKQIEVQYETFDCSSKSSMAAPETDVSKTTNSLVASEANHMESAVSA
ncbi:hypothetical protein HPP92_016101, partial [Vanilla planifolia]